MPIFCWAYLYLYTFMDSDCSVFFCKFIYSVLISIYFACCWTAASTEDVTPFSDVENQFKTCILQIVFSQRASLNILKVSVTFFINSKKIWCRHAVLSSLPLSMYTKITGETTHTCTEYITQKSHVLLHYSMGEMTQQTLQQLHIAVEISPSSSSVIWWWIRNCFNGTTIKPMPCNIKVCGMHIRVFP
jgi:hypothetical protein